MKTDLFQSCGHCWVFQIHWHTECSTFTASSFRFWNSSTGIPSSPLGLFIVMLPKAYLTSHSRMSDSGWVITPFWLSGSLKSFLYRSSVYSCHLFLISSASVKFILFLSFIVPIFVWNIPLVSLIFLKFLHFLKSILFFFFFFLAMWHVGSYFPNQGLNLHLLHWKCGVLVFLEVQEVLLVTSKFSNLLLIFLSSFSLISGLIFSYLFFSACFGVKGKLLLLIWDLYSFKIYMAVWLSL